ncbi:MAG TPA: bifunctional pyridoxamine 5'-phosphate oxidase family protein/GNAT family N-acetyltransferase [Micromonosporaceae bacterium]
MTDSFPKTARTTASRDRDRVSYERATAYAALDEAYVCHLGFAATNPQSGGCEPRVLPTLHVRIGDTLYVHGSTGSGPLLAARSEAGLAVCVTVTHLDGLVLARSQFNHTANYRSVVAHGQAHLVTDPDEKSRVLTALVDKIAHGRSAQTRPPTRRELAETAVLALPLTEVSVKARMGGVQDDPEDLDLPYWAGVVPMRLTPGLVEPEPGVTAAVPQSLRPERGPWLTAPAMPGEHVTLEPLDPSHAPELFAAIADPETYQWLVAPCPTSVEEMAGQVREALRMWELGVRVPFVQRSTETGQVVGMTSYYDIDPVNRRLAIGFTVVGRPWWRTTINTEAKILLLRRAFDELGAVRVEWHTDLRNVRSQQAIERLGAAREGVLRRHKKRADGTWRDTVLYAMTDAEWPQAHQRLADRLRAGAMVS